MEENRVVLDTHVWVSIFHKNREEDLIDAIPSKKLLLITCEEQLKEFLHIAATKEELKSMLSSKPRTYVQFIRSITQICHTEKRFSLLFDHKDNYLVDLCWQAHCILVSDDVGFRPLRKMQRPKVKVIGKRDFYELIGWKREK
jgi:putative PIN family toxin of toxin-antitoxin system